MTITYTGGADNDGSSDTPSIDVSGITINSGDLVIAYVHTNTTDATTADDAGWTTAGDEVPTSETARHSFYWRVAGGSEPSSYTWSITSAGWRVCIKVFAQDGGAFEVDSAVNNAQDTNNDAFMSCTAINGQTISDNAVSIIAGGKDARFAPNDAYDTGDQSYVSVLGGTENQATSMGHRIFTTGTSSISEVQLSGSTAIADATHSIHISFVEGAAAAAGSTYPPPTRRFLHNLVR